MRKSNFGFTLIELLIAVLIFSIIVSVIYTTFSTGTSVWKRTKTATQASMNINSVLEDLTRDLRGAVKYNGLEFIGEENKLYFCYLSDTILGDSYYTEVYRNSYYLEPSSEVAGKLDLFRRKASLVKGGFNIDEIPAENLISGLDNFEIEYAYRSTEEEVAWETTWENLEDIPKGVKIKICKGGIELTKYISVPTGDLVGLK